MGTESNFLYSIILASLFGFLPFITVVATSFAKISIVFLILRNALGIQQMPPGTLLNSLALIMTVFIMAPALADIFTVIADPKLQFRTVADYERLAVEASKPLHGFLDRFADPRQKAFFTDTSQKIWGYRLAPGGVLTEMAILLPSFLVSELTRAFEIGFLLYLPFLAIDFIVSAILVAMGMTSMNPPIISAPLKLLLFVIVDGWSRLVQGLILSYAVPS
jgi:type III secretion protein R